MWCALDNGRWRLQTWCRELATPRSLEQYETFSETIQDRAEWLPCGPPWPYVLQALSRGRLMLSQGARRWLCSKGGVDLRPGRWRARKYRHGESQSKNQFKMHLVIFTYLFLLPLHNGCPIHHRFCIHRTPWKIPIWVPCCCHLGPGLDCLLTGRL